MSDDTRGRRWSDEDGRRIDWKDVANDYEAEIQDLQAEVARLRRAPESPEPTPEALRAAFMAGVAHHSAEQSGFPPEAFDRWLATQRGDNRG